MSLVMLSLWAARDSELPLALCVIPLQSAKQCEGVTMTITV